MKCWPLPPNKASKSFMRALSKIFLKGLVAVLPIAITLYILYWLGSTAEFVLGGMIQIFLPQRYYWPGMGLIIGFMLVLVLGLFVDSLRMRMLLKGGERLLNKLPLVKTVYSATRDLMGFFSDSKSKGFNQVVLFTLPHTEIRLLGFVTQEEFPGLPAAFAQAGSVAVYLPLSYQIGGFTVFVQRAALQPIDMSVQDAMRLALTAGMSIARAQKQQ